MIDNISRKNGVLSMIKTLLVSFLLTFCFLGSGRATVTEFNPSTATGDFRNGGDYETNARLLGNASNYSLGFLQGNKIKISLFTSSTCIYGPFYVNGVQVASETINLYTAINSTYSALTANYVAAINSTYSGITTNYTAAINSTYSGITADYVSAINSTYSGLTANYVSVVNSTYSGIVGVVNSTYGSLTSNYVSAINSTNTALSAFIVSNTTRAVFMNGELKGGASFFNFTGSGVNAVSVDGGTATVTITGSAVAPTEILTVTSFTAYGTITSSTGFVGDGSKLTGVVVEDSSSTIAYKLIITTSGSDTNTFVITADGVNVMSDYFANVSTSVALSKSGAGGLDTGTEAASTWYKIFLISKGSDYGVLAASANVTEPVMPSGYTKWRDIGYVYNDASSNIVPVYKVGKSATLFNPIMILSNVNPGTSETEVDLSPYIPPDVKIGYFTYKSVANSTNYLGTFIRPDTVLTSQMTNAGDGSVLTELGEDHAATTLYSAGHSFLRFAGSRKIYYYDINPFYSDILYLILTGWEE